MFPEENTRTTHDSCNIPSGAFCLKLGFESRVTSATSIHLLVVLPLSTDHHSAFSLCDPLSSLGLSTFHTHSCDSEAGRGMGSTPSSPCLAFFLQGVLTEQLCFCPQRSLRLGLKGDGGDRFGNNFITPQECGEFTVLPEKGKPGSDLC